MRADPVDRPSSDVEGRRRTPARREARRSAARGPAGREDASPVAAGGSPTEVVAERHEVDEVVGMEMAHDDGIELARLDRAGQVRERTLAEVEDDRGRASWTR